MAGYKPRVLVGDIHSAIRRGYYSQVRALLSSGHDPNAGDSNGQTALMLCAQMKSEKWAVGVARLLLENGAQVGLRDRHKRNALHHACLREKLDLVMLFLSAVDYDLNAQDKLGNTALHYCALKDNVDLVKVVSRSLKRYKLPLGKPNKEGYTAAMIATEFGNSECANKILQNRPIAPLLDSLNSTITSSNSQTSERFNADQVIKASTPISRLDMRGQLSARSQNHGSRPLTGTTRSQSSAASVNIENLLLTIVPESKQYQRAKHDRFLPGSFKNQNKCDDIPLAEYEAPSCSKTDVLKLLNHYNYQFSKSYRKSVVPPALDEMDITDIRPSSPNYSENSEPPTEAASIISKRSLSRRSSSLQMLKNVDGSRKLQRARSKKSSMFAAGLAAMVGSQKS